MIKLAIFDLDGTLVDSMSYWEIAASELIRRKGITPKEDLCDRFLSMSLPEAAKYLKENYNLQYSIDEICQMIDDVMLEYYLTKVELKPNMLELLYNYQKLGIKMAIASSTDRELIVKCIDKLNIDKYFSYIITSTEIGKSKIHPDIYINCVNHFDVKNEETLIFEDLPYGIIATKDLGFITVGIYDKTSEKHQETLEENAEYYFKELDYSFVKAMIDVVK
ncbi:HAD family phosphatase [bacterium]|nr:HAD family phosphatase [bacterium]